MHTAFLTAWLQVCLLAHGKPDPSQCVLKQLPFKVGASLCRTRGPVMAPEGAAEGRIVCGGRIR